MDASARIYASHFTEQELKDLLAFYQTPLGQKAIAEEPKALDESMAYAGGWADNLSEEVIDEHARRDEKARTRYVSERTWPITTSIFSLSEADRAACAPRASPPSTARA